MGRLWNALIVAPSRQAAAGGWKDFKSPADASLKKSFFLFFFHNPVSSEDRGSCFFFFSGSEKDLRRQITQIAFEQVAV